MNRSEPIEKKSGILSVFFNGMKELLRSPKKLIPTFVLCAVWIVFSLMSAFGVNLPFFRFLYTLTYANGGMYGGFFGAVGGLFGKAVFAAFVNMFVLSLCEKKNPFRGFGKGVKTLALNGLTAVSPFVIGGGLGLLFYSFFNVTSAVSNSAVALVAAAAALQAAGRQNGLFFSLLFGVVGKLSKGKTPSHTTVSRLLAGISAGSAIGFPLTFTRYPILLFSVGAGLLAIGIVLAIVGKTGLKKASAAAAALFLMLGVASLPFSASLLHVRADEGGFSMVISDDEAKKIDPSSAFNDLGGVEGVLYFAFYDAGSITVNESGSGYSFSVPSYRGKGRLGTLDLGSSCSGMTFSGTDFEKTEGFNNDTYTAEFTSSGPVTVSMTSCSWTNADEIYTLTCTLDSFTLKLSFYYPARYDAETGNIQADATLRYSGTVQDSETGDSSVFEENTSYFDFTMCD